MCMTQEPKTFIEIYKVKLLALRLNSLKRKILTYEGWSEKMREWCLTDIVEIESVIDEAVARGKT